MKRKNYLFEDIIDYSNIRLAFLKAIRGKRSSLGVLRFCTALNANLQNTRQRLQTYPIHWGAYCHFTIRDPKMRTISAVPFEDRIMHHAIMNILEPVFEKPLVAHSYACRKGKGTHKAVHYAFARCKAAAWFLKLDVRTYFASIDHTLLKQQVLRLLKDEQTLLILFSIIDSFHTEWGKGLPIGNLTSQYFANYYLSKLDHFILEQLRPQGYVRYMDDMVVWADKPRLMQMNHEIRTFLHEQLHLTLKQELLGTTAQGLPFLGFLIKPKGIYLTAASKRRISRHSLSVIDQTEQGLLSPIQASQRLQSIFAPTLLARSYAFRVHLCRTLEGTGGRFRFEPGPARR
jgi:retron-type reverse transcriptase